MSHITKPKGFLLIEVILFLSIIMITFSVLAPNIQTIGKSYRTLTQKQRALLTLKNQIELFRDTGILEVDYPVDMTDLNGLTIYSIHFSDHQTIQILGHE